MCCYIVNVQMITLSPCRLWKSVMTKIFEALLYHENKMAAQKQLYIMEIHDLQRHVKLLNPSALGGW